MGHVLMDEAGSATGSRNPPQGSGLAVDATLTHATGTAEREATLVMLDRRTAGKAGGGRITLGTDKAPDTGPMTPAPSSRNCGHAR